MKNWFNCVFEVAFLIEAANKTGGETCKPGAIDDEECGKEPSVLFVCYH